jgi:ATP-dependent phosphoenolpyruvate carboxykinase
VWLLNTGWSGGAYGAGAHEALYTRDGARRVVGRPTTTRQTVVPAGQFGLAPPTEVAGVPNGARSAQNVERRRGVR